MARCLLFAVACIACCILYVCAEVPADQPTSVEVPADQPMSAEDAYEAILAALFGYKPCLDENCGARPPLTPDDSMGDAPQGMEMDDSYLLEDNPRMHCILLRPSAVDTFAAVESMHSGISAIKYKVLEELIDHMYPFSTLKVEHCRPEMKLVDFVILAANSVKTQYVLQGFSNCTYKSSKSVEQPLYPTSNKTEAICGKSTPSSEYATQGSRPDCHGVTKAPEVSTHSAPVTKSYPDGTTEKPCEGKTAEKPCAYEKQTEKPCELNVTKGQKDYPESKTESPCQKTEKVQEPYSTTEEILAEDDSGYPPFVGSLKGIPGIHYPNYTDIPLTSFSCADKKYIPGFFADLETGCQVFHVCYEHRRESFLCPKGTTFNQPILACDFWYNYNCSLAYEDYAVNEKAEFLKDEKIDLEVKELVSEISEAADIAEDAQNKSIHFDESVLEKITPFLPVKAVVTELEPVEEIVKPVHKVEITPEPVDWKPVKPKKPFLKMEPMNMEELFSKTVIPLAKAKLAALKVAAPVAGKVALPIGKLAASKVKAAAAVPVAAAKIAIPVAKVATKAKVVVPLAAAKVKTAAIVPAVAKVKAAAAVPVVAKAKLAVPVVAKSKIAAASIPVIAKGKVAAVAAPKVVAKAFIPVLAAKKVASAVPLAKAKAAPALKAKLIKGGAPLFKAKALSLPLAKTTLIGAMPLMKAKLVKSAAISPLTKKALALGYMKLLKAKKIPLMG